MILLDLNQVFLANLHVSFFRDKSTELNEDLVRHMILNSIRANYMKFKNEYGDMVIACDSRNNWRKQVFPYYKASRKKAREESTLDWNKIFLFLNKVRDELKVNFPYPVVEVESAEADDVIAAMVKRNNESPDFGHQLREKILIISGDKDFIQLHNEHVQQYDPVKKKFIKHDSPTQFRLEHILKGDMGDGVPNVLSDDDTFVTGKRQRPLSTKKLERWSRGIPAAEKNQYIERNYARNEQLIDLTKVPADIESRIFTAYVEQTKKDRRLLMNYFIKHRLRGLMENISDF